MNAPVALVKRWFLSAIGVVALLATLLVVGVSHAYTLYVGLIEATFAIVVSLVLIYVGYRYYAAADLHEDHAWTVARWTGLGFAGLLAINGWFRVTEVFFGTVDPAFAAITALTGGTVFGAVIGIYNARGDRRRDRREAALTDYEEIFEGVQDAVLITDPETATIVDANRQAAKLYGYEQDELIGMTVQALTADDERFDAEATGEYIEAAMAGETQQFDWLAQLGDGSTLWTEVTLRGTTIGGDERLLAVARDVEERRGREEALADYQQIFEGVRDAVFVHDLETSTIIDANERAAELLGYEKDQLLGRTVPEISADDSRFELEAAMGLIEDAVGGETQQFEWLLRRADGRQIWAEVTIKVASIGGEDRLLAVARDIESRKEHEQTHAELRRATLKLTRANSRDEALGITVETAQSILDQPFSMVWSVDREAGVLRGVAASDRTAAALDPAIEALEHQREDPLWELYETGKPTVIEAVPPDFTAADIDIESIIAIPLGDHGILTLGTEIGEGADGTDVDLANVLGSTLTAVLDGLERERILTGLHGVTRDMLDAPDRETVADLVVDAAQEVLGFTWAVVWLEGGDDVLAPTAHTTGFEATFGEIVTWRPSVESVSMAVYESGETAYVEDVEAEPEAHEDATGIRSGIAVPLGKHGVMNFVSMTIDAFDDSDVALADLLGLNARVALDRVERESTLSSQADQLEFFNSILRHDVLNAVTVIKGRGDFLADELEGRQREFAETIVSWSDDITEIVERVRVVIETLTGEGDPELTTVDLVGAARDEVGRMETTYEEATIETEFPETATVRANELLGDVVGNLVHNAFDHNDPADLTIRVSVNGTAEGVTLRVDDDGKGVPAEETDTIFRRGETGHAKVSGSGFGLFFVDAMCNSYGASVHYEDSELGGAAFVVEFPPA